jgi:hypothetical protein
MPNANKLSNRRYRRLSIYAHNDRSLINVKNYTQCSFERILKWMGGLKKTFLSVFT